MQENSSLNVEELSIELDSVSLKAELVIPENALGIVVFAHTIRLSIEETACRSIVGNSVQRCLTPGLL